MVSYKAEIVTGRIIASAAAAYILFIAISCPCEPNLYSCHLGYLYLALLIFVVVLIYFNGPRVANYH